MFYWIKKKINEKKRKDEEKLRESIANTVFGRDKNDIDYSVYELDDDLISATLFDFVESQNKTQE